MINYRLKNAKNLLLDKKLTYLVIIFFEFFGTLLFTYSNLNLLNLKNSPSSNIYDKIMYGFIDFALSMLMCISYTRQFAGGVYNPAVVVFRMLRRTDRFPVKTGVIYIVSQISGSIVGAFIGKYLIIKHSILIMLILHQLQDTCPLLSRLSILGQKWWEDSS